VLLNNSDVVELFFFKVKAFFFKARHLENWASQGCKVPQGTIKA